MQSSLAERVTLLKEMALFRELSEPELEQIGSRLHDYLLAANQLLYGAGDRAENFYLVADGLLLNQEIREGRRVGETTLETGDAFGAGALLAGGARKAAVSALRDSHLFYMTRPDFNWMLNQYPRVAGGLRQFSMGKQLKGEVDFDWLEEGEKVFYVARKHIGYLWFRLTRSMGLAILGLLAFLFAIGAPSGSQFYWVGGGGLLLFGAVGLGIWEALDWRNDFYIVTNLRVVWLEQVLLRSSSCTEAPLANIQSVNVHSSLMGRLLGFGDVIVRTYTGTVKMPSVGDPMNTKHLIEDYAARLKKESRHAKHESIRQAVRETLGYAPEAEVQPAARSALPLIDREERFSLFKTRTIQGDTITYHKHWFSLLSNLFLPTLFFIGVLVGLPLIFQGMPNSPIGWLVSLAAVVAPVAVVLYRILDWQNDIYVLTPDSLIDTEKKPLGSEVTKSAPLANVLSLENHKVGLLGLLLNFGVVRINVGDTALDFESVANPVQVQQDIFARMEALKVNQEQGQVEDERRRMTEWLRVYEQERGRGGQAPGRQEIK
ncbi:MAG: cyclic nucleotide-binding domain-containing protein [Chloroflexi bacterium]|nr:cyclic nucleotide-binding domain-containing protein [Chloroflexota bacterium]